MTSLVSRRFLALLAAAGLVASGTARPEPPAAPASGPAHLAELFVSQACGNCPGAMRVIAEEVAHHPDVFVLTWSVDYWDYLGWQDSFARPEFAARQAEYAARLKARGPYTPMLVVDGRMQVAGNKKRKVCTAFDGLRSDLSADMAVVDFPAGAFSFNVDGRSGMQLELIEYTPGQFVFTPPAGSNAGRDMIYTNLVTSSAPLEMSPDGEVSGNCKSQCVVIARVSDPSPGSFLIARMGDGDPASPD